MNSELYKAIKYSRKRLVPAIDRQCRKNPVKEFLFQYLRVLSPLGEIPLSLKRNYQFFLDGVDRPNTKAGNALRELISAGFNKGEIWHKSHTTTGSINKVSRILIRLPWLCMVFIKNLKVFSLFDLISLQVFVGYEAYKQFFTRHERMIPIIISDLSPTLHMQWSAALAIKRDVLWWQDDYHHYTGFSAENYMPYPCTYAAVLNKNGLETVLQKNPGAKVFARPQTTVKVFKTIPSNPRLGVATNAFFEASASQLQLINEFRENLGASVVQFRLHPNSKLTPHDFNMPWIQISPSGESIEQYCEKVDMVVVGNSAVQLKLLCAGVPVIHTRGLDNFGFDLYGYCGIGFCYGINDLSQFFSLKEINRFYQGAEMQERLKGFVNVRQKLPSLLAVKLIA